MKKIILILTILGIFIISTPTMSILAQDKTEPVAQEASKSSGITDIKKIIQKKMEDNKVKGAIDDLLNQKISMIGQVSRITDGTITIKNKSETRILDLSSNPKIIKNKKVIDVDKVEVENWAMVLGKLKDDNFTPHFIFIYSKTLRPKTQVVMLGTIVEVSSLELTINPRSNDENRTLKLTSETKYRDSDGEKIGVKDFSKDINVLITGFDNDGNVTVTTLKSLAPLSE